MRLLFVLAILPFAVYSQGFGDVVNNILNSTNDTSALVNSTLDALNSTNGTSMLNSTAPGWAWSDAENGWKWVDENILKGNGSTAGLNEVWPMVMAWISHLNYNGFIQNGRLDFSALKKKDEDCDDDDDRRGRVGFFKLNMAEVQPTLVSKADEEAAAGTSSTTLIVSLVSTLVLVGALAGLTVVYKKRQVALKESARLDALVHSWARQRKLLPEHMTFGEMEEKEKGVVVWEEDVVAMLATALVEEEELRREYAAWGIQEEAEEDVDGEEYEGEEYEDSEGESFTSGEAVDYYAV